MKIEVRNIRLEPALQAVWIQAELLHHVLEIGTVHQENQEDLVDHLDDLARGVLEVAVFNGQR